MIELFKYLLADEKPILILDVVGSLRPCPQDQLGLGSDAGAGQGRERQLQIGSSGWSSWTGLGSPPLYLKAEPKNTSDPLK